MRRRRVVLVGVAAAAALGVGGGTAWWSEAQPELRVPGGMHVGLGSVAVADPQLSYVDEPCVDGAGEAEVLAVDAVEARGAVVSGFGVQHVGHDEVAVGSTAGRLEDVRDVTWTRTVASTCSGGGAADRSVLVVELLRTGDEGGVVDGLRVRYRVDGRERTVPVDFRVDLCADACSGGA